MIQERTGRDDQVGGREVRRALGLSMDALAYKAGVSPNSVRAWERGRWISLRVLDRIGRALGMDRRSALSAWESARRTTDEARSRNPDYQSRGVPDAE